MATKTKLEAFSGDTFDKSYIKGMIKDHEEDIALFKKEATSGQDPQAKAFAAATLPTLRARRLTCGPVYLGVNCFRLKSK